MHAAAIAKAAVQGRRMGRRRRPKLHQRRRPAGVRLLQRRGPQPILPADRMPRLLLLLLRLLGVQPKAAATAACTATAADAAKGWCC